jgi:hypothetical protein
MSAPGQTAMTRTSGVCERRLVLDINNIIDSLNNRRYVA